MLLCSVRRTTVVVSPEEVSEERESGSELLFASPFREGVGSTSFVTNCASGYFQDLDSAAFSLRVMSCRVKTWF